MALVGPVWWCFRVGSQGDAPVVGLGAFVWLTQDPAVAEGLAGTACCPW